MPSRIEDQERLLEEMISIQADIRKQNERKRILKSNDDELYSKMFKPVTRSIQKLVAPPISSHHSRPPPLPPAVKEPSVNDDDEWCMLREKPRPAAITSAVGHRCMNEWKRQSTQRCEG